MNQPNKTDNEPQPTQGFEVETLLHDIQFSIDWKSAHNDKLGDKLEKFFKVPVKCCDFCYWMDGFTGECVLGFNDGTPYTAEERKKCPYPDAYRFGHSPLMDNHDVMRDGPTHEQTRKDHALWMNNARMFRLQFKGKYFGVKKDGQ